MTYSNDCSPALVVIPTTMWVASAISLSRVGAGPYGDVSRRPCHWSSWGRASAYLPMRPWVLAVWCGVLSVATLWWLSLRPKSDRDWKPGMGVLPHIEPAGDVLSSAISAISGNGASGEPLPQYEERTFDLTKLSTLDYFLAHWSGPAIGDTMVSFGFDDGQYLVVSVEARRRRGQPYSALRGLYKSYELIYIIGDEGDIIVLFSGRMSAVNNPIVTGVCVPLFQMCRATVADGP